MSFEARYARALVAADPVAALRRLARDRRLDARLRRQLASVDEDGVRLTALLIARLRFERLLRGSSAAERWYDADPLAFTAAFRRYHQRVLPTAFSPAAEAKQWNAFLVEEQANRQGERRRIAALPESAR